MRLFSTGKYSILYHNHFGKIQALPKSLEFIALFIGDSLLFHGDVSGILEAFIDNQSTHEYSRTKLYYWCRDKTSRDKVLSLLDTRRIMREQKRNIEARLDEINTLLQDIGGPFY